MTASLAGFEETCVRVDGQSLQVRTADAEWESVVPSRKLRGRLDEAEYELWALQQYQIALERQLQQLIDQTPAQALRSLRDQGRASDASAVAVVEQEIAELVERVYPRYFRSPFVLILCAVFESILVSVADAFREFKSAGLRLGDFHGDLLDRAVKYFLHVLGHPLDLNSSGWQRIKIIYTIRHCLIHAHGVVTVMRSDQQQQLASVSQTVAGFAIVDGYIVLSDGFLRESSALVVGWLRNLMRAIEREIEKQRGAQE